MATDRVHEQTSIKDSIPRISAPTYSRRSVLRGARDGAALIAALAVGVRPGDGNVDRSSPDYVYSVTSDILREKDLEKANIKILRTTDTGLHLGRGMLNWGLFKDSAEGNIKEAVLVLVDSGYVSWDSSGSMPEEARLMWQAQTIAPRERPRSYWLEQEKFLRQQNEDLVQDWQSASGNLQKILSGEAEREIAAKIASMGDALKQIKDPQVMSQTRSNLTLWSQSLDEVKSGEKLDGYRRQIKLDDSKIARNEDTLARMSDLPAYVDFLSRTGDMAHGGIMQTVSLDSLTPETYRDSPEYASRHDDLLNNHPELLGKVFIFVPVGGDMKPSAAKSASSKLQFLTQDSICADCSSEPGEDGARILNLADPGDAVVHEAAHWAGVGKPFRSEADADRAVIKHRQEAAGRKRGDNSQAVILANRTGGLEIR